MSRITGFSACFGVLALVLALSTEARAEDWSQFIDNSPQKPLIHVSGPSKQAPAPAPRAATKAVAKPTKVARVNARAKTKKHR